MTSSEMHIRFKLGVDKLDSLSSPNLASEVVDILLNRAQERIVKQRMSGLNVHRTSFEETQKRRDDLRVLMTNAVLTPAAPTSDNKPYGVFVTLPTNPLYWFATNEEVDVYYKPCNASVVTTIEYDKTYLVFSGSIVYDGITYNAPSTFSRGTATTYTGTGKVYEASSKRTQVKPVTHDEYNSVIRDPFGKPDENQVLSLMFGNQIELLGEEGFALGNYYLRYIRKPQTIVFNSVDCELADHLHDEIVDIAVSMTLEEIESPRYQTNLNEQRSQE